MENLFAGTKKTPMPLQALLKKFHIRYWQIVQRCASKGVFVRENTLSRVLSGLETANPEIQEELDVIYQALLEKKLNEKR